jgi:hypothetical protein
MLLRLASLAFFAASNGFLIVSLLCIWRAAVEPLTLQVLATFGVLVVVSALWVRFLRGGCRGPCAGAGHDRPRREG